MAYLRCNNTEAVIGEWQHISQATVSRYMTFLLPLISTCLDELASFVRHQAIRSDLIIDGFLIPTGDLTGVPGLYLGKRHAVSANAQLITDLHGRPVDAGHVLIGSTHDARALADSGIAKTYQEHLSGDGPIMIGDCGYIGVVPLTPYRKPPYRALTITELLFNRQVNQRRWVVEQGISHLKSYKTLKTGYRRPPDMLHQTLQCVTKL